MENEKRRDNREDREMHDATCSECGVETKVPFVPDPNRPIYCRECFQKRKRNGPQRFNRENNDDE